VFISVYFVFFPAAYLLYYYKHVGLDHIT